MDIDGRIAVVTGAATGIGRATAVALARRGAKAVVVGDVDADGAEETVSLVKDSGAQGAFVLTDVSDSDQVAALLAEAIRLFGRLDILHNNAGLVSGDPPWPGTPVERINALIGVNVGGTLVGTKLGIDAMAATGGGAIVNTASIAGLAPMPFDAVYAASKAAIILFTQSCALVKESHGVRVNAVLPAMVDTPIIAKTGDGTNPAGWLKPLIDSGAMPLLAPESIAAAVVELVLDDSKAGETVTIMPPGMPAPA